MELAGLDRRPPGCDPWATGDSGGLQGTLSRSWGFRRVSESPSLPRSTDHTRATRAASCVFPADAIWPAFLPRAFVREWRE
jgi:hypothetical protein